MTCGSMSAEHDTAVDSDSFFATAVVFELGLGAAALLLGWLFDFDARMLIPETSDLASIAGGIAWGAAAALPILAAVFLLERLPIESVRRLSQLTEERLMQPMRHLSVLDLCCIALAAGVGEELLFRGWLQGWLIGPPSEADPTTVVMGVGAASLAFGLVHPISPTYVIVAALIGLYLGSLTVLTGNLLVPITAHALYDAVQLVLAQRQLNARPSANG